MENCRKHQLTSEEVIKGNPVDLAAEHEAVHAYMAHACATDNPVAKAGTIDIANEVAVDAGGICPALWLSSPVMRMSF